MGLRNLIKSGLVTRNTNDSENIPQMQIMYLGKVTDAAILLPYGMSARPIPNDTLCLVFSIQGIEENRIAIPLATTNRKKNLKDGETVLENQVTGNFIYMKEDGNMEVNIPADLLETVRNITINASGNETININGNATVVLGGNATIQAASALLTIPTVTLAGNLIVNGTITNNGTNVGNTHTHPAGTPPGNTGPVN